MWRKMDIEFMEFDCVGFEIFKICVLEWFLVLKAWTHVVLKFLCFWTWETTGFINGIMIARELIMSE